MANAAKKTADPEAAEAPPMHKLESRVEEFRQLASDYANGACVMLPSALCGHGDVFYGASEIDGVSFMTRERAPFRDDIDLDALSKKSWCAYAEVCGRTLAQAHARSDEAGEIDYDVEPKIIDAMTPSKLFAEDVLEFAQEAADRVRRDHAFFRADHKLGAFRNIEMVYR